MNNVAILENKIGYVFKNKNYAKTAITHKSYAYDKGIKSLNAYNERIEFLGDAILEHIVSIKLYNELSNVKEGELTKKRARIVCESSLCDAIKKYKLEECIKLGKCELKTGGKRKNALLADMFEAIIGAIYLDSDFNTANNICLMLLNNVIEDQLKTDSQDTDYKTRLQEEVQKERASSVEYILTFEEGLPHDRTFYTEVIVNGKKAGEGNGKTKKESEQNAAKKALEDLYS